MAHSIAKRPRIARRIFSSSKTANEFYELTNDKPMYACEPESDGQRFDYGSTLGAFGRHIVDQFGEGATLGAEFRRRANAFKQRYEKPAHPHWDRRCDDSMFLGGNVNIDPKLMETAPGYFVAIYPDTTKDKAQVPTQALKVA